MSASDPSREAPIGLTVLGATGSIGLNTLDVVNRHPGRYKIIALTANSQTERLVDLCAKFRPEFAVMTDPDCAQQLHTKLRHMQLDTQVLSGEEGLIRVASLDNVEYVMAAIVGAAGLKPTLAAAQKGKRVLLANKEALVMSGKIFMQTVKEHNAELLPIDSEHNAIFQCMPGNLANSFREAGLNNSGIRKILLTASGGPFRETPLQELKAVTPQQACAHPKWKMGPKISVDSATMMNKGLEVIEACWLFNTSAEFIQVVMHPQSIVHSMVQYTDGSVLAQLGNPDMRTPIAHAIAWPNRMESGVDSLELFTMGHLEFLPPDMQRFPCLQLAIDAINKGGTCPAILNAANEIAVEAFLANKLYFTDIATVIEKTVSQLVSRDVDSLDVVLEDDEKARQVAREILSQLSHN